MGRSLSRPALLVAIRRSPSQQWILFVICAALWSVAFPRRLPAEENHQTAQELSDIVRWPNGKAYFFYKSGQYVAFDVAADKAEDGYPKPIAGKWPGVWENGIDAAILWKDGNAYFFKGDEYIRYNVARDAADEGYPAKISTFWKGLFTEGIDAAVRWNDGKAYFFKGDKVVVYDVNADHGEKRMNIIERFPGVWSKDIDAVELWNNGKAYFFKGDRFISFDVAKNKADEGYPKSILGNWRNMTDNQAASFGWKGVADTGYAFSNFFSKDFTLTARFMPQYPFAYNGPILAENRESGFVVGQGDIDTKLIVDAAMALPGGAFALVGNATKAYFFRGDQVLRFDIPGNKADDGYPKLITEEFPGIFPRDIDAAVPWPIGKIYFFKGEDYILYDALTHQVKHRAKIKDHWHGLWTSDIDAALPYANGNIYFFKGTRYQRYNMTADKVDGELDIKTEWKDLDVERVDAAALWPNGKAFFFHGTQFTQFDVKNNHTDLGFPKGIAEFGTGVAYNLAANLVVKVGSQARFYAVSGMKTGTWANLALVRAKNTYTLFFNGIQLHPSLEVDPNDPNLPVPTNTLRFGKRTDADQAQFYGFIDDVAVFDKALTSRELETIRSQPRGRLTGKEPHLIKGWTFDDNRNQPDVLKNSTVLFRSLTHRMTPSGATLIARVRSNVIDSELLPLPFQQVKRQLPFKAGQSWRVVQGSNNPFSSHRGAAAFALDLALTGEESANKPTNPHDDTPTCGEPILATAAGTIETSWFEAGGGGPDDEDFDEPNHLYVVHTSSESSSYFHLASGSITKAFPRKKPPIPVALGQKVGVAGTLNHCHLHTGVFENADGSGVDFPQEFSDYEASDDQGKTWRKVERGTPRVGQWIRRPIE